MQTLKQSIRLLLIIGLLAAVRPACAQTWTLANNLTNYNDIELAAPTAPWMFWNSIVSSADGSKLEAVGYYAPTPFNNAFSIVYSSTNSGTTWTANIPNLPYFSWVGSVTCSADGTKLAAICISVYTVVNNSICISTNSGATWTQTSAPVSDWTSIASSADGKTLVLIGYNTPVCVSTNSGATWTATAEPWFWTAVAVSADGSKMVATSIARTNAIYVSTDYGTSWTSTLCPDLFWISVASSSDGTKLVAAASWPPFGGIATSTNSGITWKATGAPDLNWISVASSADGAKLVAAVSGGQIYTSIDSGATWTVGDAPSTNWQSVVSSADGSKLLAEASDGRIYTSQSQPAPNLMLTFSPTNLMLRWTVPSTNFVLQQSADLLSWADVTNPPVLNLNNLLDEVSLPPSGSSGFYRLKTP